MQEERRTEVSCKTCLYNSCGICTTHSTIGFLGIDTFGQFCSSIAEVAPDGCLYWRKDIQHA